MTAAFEATYSDWKLIRSRKVVQLVLEVPIEAADKAYQVLGGMPNPAGEIWVAVARLDPGVGTERSLGSEKEAPRPALGNESHVPNSGFDSRDRGQDRVYTAPEKGEASPPTVAPGAALPPRRFTSLPLPQQAVLLCKDARFRAFVSEYCRTDVMPENEFTGWLRIQAGVSSRRELRPDTDGGRWFVRMRDRYLAEKLAA